MIRCFGSVNFTKLPYDRYGDHFFCKLTKLGICTFFLSDPKMKFGAHFCIQNFFSNFLVSNNLLMSVRGV